MIDASLVADRVAALRTELRSIAGREVAIVAVTKSLGRDAIDAAASAGCDAVGENYAQEVLSKVADAPLPLPLHFIGAIQSNKVRQLAPHVSLWQGVERDSVVDEIARRAPGAAILLQVNTTGEGSKSGLAPADAGRMCERALGAGLDVRGLMTIGPTNGSAREIRAAFGSLRALADDLGLVECSMGMSADWRIAAECGSTMVRIGTMLFGPRR